MLVRAVASCADTLAHGGTSAIKPIQCTAAYVERGHDFHRGPARPTQCFYTGEVLAAMTIIGLLAGLAYRNSMSSRTGQIARAIVTSRHGGGTGTTGTLPATLAGIGRAGRWILGGRVCVLPVSAEQGKAPPKGAPRKDRFLVPINSEYDLTVSGKTAAAPPH